MEDQEVELSKKVEHSTVTLDILPELFEEAFGNGFPFKGTPKPSEVTFGVNDIKKQAITQLPGNKIRFFLPNFKRADRVYLSGTFNNWSTTDYQMLKVEGKWMFPLYLSKGKYTYKFIVDGEWITDPLNELYEENRFGADNSVLWME